MEIVRRDVASYYQRSKTHMYKSHGASSMTVRIPRPQPCGVRQGKLLEEELPENIEYVSARNGGDTGMEVWSIQRDDSHMTCYIEPYTTPVWCTISDMSTEGREFAEAYPRGLDEGEVGEFFENNR